MKKNGIMHAELMHQIAALGHMETFLIGDAGMPIPKGVPIIDLALCRGIPAFTDVLDAVLAETKVEFYYVAEETARQNKSLQSHLERVLPGIPHQSMPHSQLKELSRSCKFAIRTGECSSFANVILRAGVTF